MHAVRTFALAVLGCRANQEELDALRSHLLAQGAIEVPYPGPADLVVVNTCAVTAGAEAQSRQVVRQASRSAAGGTLVVTGCAAQLDPHTFGTLVGGGCLFGNADKAPLLARLARDGAPAAGMRVVWSPDATSTGFLPRVPCIAPRRTRALLKIQDGCDLGCSYCVVPRVRGRPVSRDAQEVVAAAEQLAAAGLREIVVTGVNLGLYGATARDGGAARLPALLRQLAALPGHVRIRLSSIEPLALSDELIDAIASSPRICPHLHVPLQSGDDGVLRRMRRPYGVEAVRARVARIIERLPHCGLGFDLIAGFPGEDEPAFAATLAFVEDLPATYLHAFGYSARPGTPAATLGPAIPPEVRRERVRALRALDARLRLRFQSRLEGERCALLVERVAGEEFEGLTAEYVRMRGRAAHVRPGDLISVVAGEPQPGASQLCRLIDGSASEVCTISAPKGR